MGYKSLAMSKGTRSSCTTCSITFSSKTSHTTHKIKCHGMSAENMIKCDMCDTYCVNKSSLHMHKLMKHQGDYKIIELKCPQCNFTCSTEKGVERHQQQTHEKIYKKMKQEIDIANILVKLKNS